MKESQNDVMTEKIEMKEKIFYRLKDRFDQAMSFLDDDKQKQEIFEQLTQDFYIVNEMEDWHYYPSCLYDDSYSEDSLSYNGDIIPENDYENDKQHDNKQHDNRQYDSRKFKIVNDQTLLDYSILLQH